MGVFTVRQGRDIKIKGAASKELVNSPLPSRIALKPTDLRGLKSRILVRENDVVKVGTPILIDKLRPEIKVVSPVSGKISLIERGDKRVLLRIVIDCDGRQEPIVFRQFSPNEIKSLSDQDTKVHLLEGGCWPFIRQRPFSKIANPSDHPKSIFVQAINTEPLAPDIDFILKNKEQLFQAGLDVLKCLTNGNVHLCMAKDAESKALTQAQNVLTHQFSGPHPCGNVSTHIHFIDPIKKGDIVWYLHALDVLRIGHLFLNGTFLPEKYVAVTGEGAKNRVYLKTIIGAPLRNLVEPENNKGPARYISGNILSGTNVGMDGSLSLYDSQVTVIPEGGRRTFLGWLTPGFCSYSFTKTFVSSFLPKTEASLDTDTHGSNRAIVLNEIYDELVPLDIMTYFLVKAVLAGEIEETEKLGILECDEEDFALCSFACPSKVDVSGIIRSGLDLLEKES